MEKDTQAFNPFETVEESYENTGTGLIQTRILYAFPNVFRLPRGLVSSRFKEVMNQVLREDYPNFRCSSARAIFEGRVPGVSKPIETINPSWKKHLEQSLTLLDFFETVVHRYLEEELKKASADTKTEVRGMSKALGTIKIPRLVEFLDQEKKSKGSFDASKGNHLKGSSDAIKNKKTGSTNGSPVKRKDKAGVSG